MYTRTAGRGSALSAEGWLLDARAGGWLTLASRKGALIGLLVAAVGCDRGMDLMPFMRRSRMTIDSLSTQNASLRAAMVMFERISAEKDTLLREVRDAHVLIEAVGEALKHMDGSPGSLAVMDSITAAMGGGQRRRRWRGSGRGSRGRDPGRARKLS